jgi:hypothetical protein
MSHSDGRLFLDLQVGGEGLKLRVLTPLSYSTFFRHLRVQGDMLHPTDVAKRALLMLSSAFYFGVDQEIEHSQQRRRRGVIVRIVTQV